MMADGSAAFAGATGLNLDLLARGMGFLAALLDAGRRRRGPGAERRGTGQVEVSDSATMLNQAKALKT